MPCNERKDFFKIIRIVRLIFLLEIDLLNILLLSRKNEVTDFELH